MRFAPKPTCSFNQSYSLVPWDSVTWNSPMKSLTHIWRERFQTQDQIIQPARAVTLSLKPSARDLFSLKTCHKRLIVKIKCTTSTTKSIQLHFWNCKGIIFLSESVSQIRLFFACQLELRKPGLANSLGHKAGRYNWARLVEVTVRVIYRLPPTPRAFSMTEKKLLPVIKPVALGAAFGSFKGGNCVWKATQNLRFHLLLSIFTCHVGRGWMDSVHEGP